MLKYRDEPNVAELLAQATAVFEEWNKQQKVLMTIDVDPYVLL